ncbi:DUF3885 domain-containing protein [Hymenobacter rigui]|uniref:DUF3885 domain-containing protein n=1 Tax=Hymenobacter rigui TaxID=334424 RepID=A0A3R9PB96_9BACT|nr:DUF3885 domain-containing protein [Hymenobacter rigui]
MTASISEFLHHHYPGLALGPGLFYCWPIGLRFDLQAAGTTSDDAYFTGVTQRAVTVFEAVFLPTDLVLIVVQRSRYTRWYRRWRFRASNLVLRLLHACKQEVQFSRLANRTRFANTAQLIRFTLERQAADIPYRQLLPAISHQDFPPRTPRLHDDVFFVNIRSGLVLHMYDDRGLDVIGPSTKALQPIYQSHQHLLLDYDREQMDATFACSV